MTQPLIDQPREVRAEDALDLARVHDFMKKQLPGLEGELRIRQFRGGASNLTYLLTFDHAEYILRCPPSGTRAKGAHDMAREYNIMVALKPYYPCVPGMIAYSDDETVIGKAFYVMEKITGIIPRANMPAGLSMTPETTRQMCLAMLDKLIELHRIGIAGTPLEKFGKGEGYGQRQIEGWSHRYWKAKTWNVPSCEYVMGWLKDHLPAEERLCFIHNDFRFDNVVFDAGDPMRIIGILDWELSTAGDPLMDLGSSLAYWVQADDDFILRSVRRQPTHLPGMLTRKEVVDYYLDKMGFPGVDFTFYEVYGLFRLAVIVQQIYYRYHHRQTTNPAFKNFWFLVNYLNWRCRRIIRRGEG